MISVTINGEKRQVDQGQSLLDLLRHLELEPGTVVVEHNRAIVRRPALGETVVRDGDTVEVVHFVGGG